MKYLLLSDLHLVDGSGADDFGNNDESLILWIKQHNPDRIIIVGDALDIDQAKYKKIYKAHSKILDYLVSRGTVFIEGNHDKKMHFKDKNMLIILSDDRKVYIAHGHKWDNKMDSPIVKGTVKILSLIERIPFLHWIDNPEVYLKKHHAKVVKKTEDYAKKLLKKYDIVIFGHIHKIFIYPYPEFIYPEHGGIYANCGDCMHGNFKGLMLDTEQNDLSIV